MLVFTFVFVFIFMLVFTFVFNFFVDEELIAAISVAKTAIFTQKKRPRQGSNPHQWNRNPSPYPLGHWDKPQIEV